jgi:hypothetical protein
MVQFDYAENSDGEIINAADIVADERHRYANLVCPACRQPMTAAVGKVVLSHFRHRVGEHCSDYFAKVIEKTIVHSYHHSQVNQQAYELILPDQRVINLAKSGAELELHQTNNGCRVDLRFRTQAGQIEVVVSRRVSDMHLPEFMNGNCIAIDAQRVQTHGVKNLVGLFKTGITTDSTFIRFFRQGSEMTVGPMQNRPSKISKPAKLPIEKQPGETTEDYRFRILGRRF